MHREPGKVIDELNRLDVTGFGPDWIRTARILADAVALIEEQEVRIDELVDLLTPEQLNEELHRLGFDFKGNYAKARERVRLAMEGEIA